MESKVRHPARETISTDEARRIALAAQRFADPRPSGRVDARHVGRVIPAMPAPSRDDAQRELIRIVARAHGIAAQKQLGDYFHLPAAHAKARVTELVLAGELIPVRVEGVLQQMYLWLEAATPPKVHARALQSALLALAVHAEPDVGETDVAVELAEELHLMANWLELDRVLANGQGDLGPGLARAVNAGE
jgi:uncharacterized protein YcaQ